MNLLEIIERMQALKALKIDLVKAEISDIDNFIIENEISNNL